MTNRLSAAVALTVDAAWGEPPARLHPTVWMGDLLRRFRARRRRSDHAGAFAEGLLAVAVGVCASALAGRWVDGLLRGAPSPAREVLRGAALKPALALRALVAAAGEVETALRAGDLDEARRALAWHLVSRDTGALTAAEVAGAAIESIAENLGDGVVGPLLAFRLGGLGGAYAYRFANTADAMLGYRTPELEWYGKPAARLDDALNLVPSRAAALLIALAAPAGGGRTEDALRCARRDAGRTASPNAGWPMAAMAGALGVRLDKRGAYALNDAGRAATADDVARARRIVRAAGWIALGMAS